MAAGRVAKVQAQCVSNNVTVNFTNKSTVKQWETIDGINSSGAIPTSFGPLNPGEGISQPLGIGQLTYHAFPFGDSPIPQTVVTVSVIDDSATCAHVEVAAQGTVTH